MMATSIKQGKILLRKEMKAKLSAIPDHLKTIQSQIVTKKVLAHPAYEHSQRVSVYLSMKNEVNTDSLVQNILNSNRACYVPRYDGSAMSMVRLRSWQDYLDLPETKWKIKQPAVEEDRDDALKTGGLDLILTPGVAFTRDGGRCGHGKGYYDSYLSLCEDRGFKPVTIALAFREQLCEDIPLTPNDRRLDYVITPTDGELKEACNAI